MSLISAVLSFIDFRRPSRECFCISPRSRSEPIEIVGVCIREVHGLLVRNDQHTMTKGIGYRVTRAGNGKQQEKEEQAHVTVYGRRNTGLPFLRSIFQPVMVEKPVKSR